MKWVCWQALQEQGCLSYRGLTAEGPTGPRRLAQVSPGVDTARITFMRVSSVRLQGVWDTAQRICLHGSASDAASMPPLPAAHAACMCCVCGSIRTAFM